MDQRKWRRGTGFTAIGVIVLLLIGLLWSSSTDTEDDTPTLEEEIASDLTVRPGDILPEAARCTSDEFINNSLKQVREGNPAFRQWSDSVSTPFVSEDKDEMLLELFAEHCGNPTELDMSIQALSDVTVRGFNIGENNPWMGEFLQMAEEDGLRSAFLTLKEGEGDDIFVTKGYQSYAAMTNTILLAFNNTGVEKKAVSVYNWHLAGPVAGELPRAVLNKQQEGLPTLKLVYTVKDGCPLVVIGYNVGDKRFEGFKPPVCETVPGGSSTTTPGSPDKSTTTTRPGGTTTTTRPEETTTTTVCTSKFCTGSTVTTQAPPPTTAPSPTTTPPNNGGQGDSGDGSTNTTQPPTTSTTAAYSPPTTTPPGPLPPPPPG